MAAVYEGVGYDTLEEALIARAADTSQSTQIVIDGTTAISDSGALVLTQTVEIVGRGGAANSGLTGTLRIDAADTVINGVAFSNGSGTLVTVLASGVTISNSAFDGGTTASRAFVASNPDLNFTNNQVTGFVNGSYINGGVTGLITGNTVSNSGNGFINDSPNVNLSGNTFSNIDRSNVSISAEEETTFLSQYFGPNTFDGTGTQIAATRYDTAKTIIGTDVGERIVVADGATSGFDFDGRGGDDLIDSGAGADTFTGGAGSDTVQGTGAFLNGDTFVDFGADDRIVVTDASDDATVTFANGQLRIDLDGNAATTGDIYTVNLQNQGAGTYSIDDDGVVRFVGTPPIEGGDGDEQLTGTDGDDVIIGGDGQDTIVAGGGNDSVVAGSGDALIYGNQGNDTIEAGPGNNTVFGGQGDDSITAGTFNNQNDFRAAVVIAAEADSNLIYGGQGADFIGIGSDGNNTIFGGSAEVDTTDLGDRIEITGSGNNLVYGNAGDDLITIQDAGNFSAGSNTVYGGQGADQVSVFGGAVGSTSSVIGGAGSDAVNVITAGAAVVYGGNQQADTADLADQINVRLAGAEATAEIYGNGGADQIFVQNGFFGGEENVLGGSASVFGGQGDDSILAFVNTGYFAGGLDSDDITVIANGENASVTVFGGNEEANPADSDDNINVSVAVGGEAFVYGNGGGDTINVSSDLGGAVFHVYGGQGNDSISTSGAGLGDGSEVFGGIGADQINVSVAGEDSSVTIYGGNGVVDAEGDADLITVTLNGAGQSATLYGNGGADVITFSGEGSVTAFGGAGDDTFVINGFDTGYTVTGGTGSDTFFQTAPGTFDDASAVGASDVGYITDVNFDVDTFQYNVFTEEAEEGGTVQVGTGSVDNAVDLVGYTPLNVQEESYNAIENAETLGEAGQAAIAFLVEYNIAQADDNTAVVFSYNGDSYMALDIGTDGDLDGIVRITGYTGTLDADDFTQPTLLG